MNAFSTKHHFSSCRNGQTIPLAAIPCLPVAPFRTAVIEQVNHHGGRLASLFGWLHQNRLRLMAVIARDEVSQIDFTSTELEYDSYPALTTDLPQAALFERELAEQWHITPENHPWLKPVRFESPRRAADRNVFARTPAAPGDIDYFTVEGEQIHEVAVGPVHAGIIEPGHFRFQCFGEKVLNLEVSLGYQHRGIEKHLKGGPDLRSLHYLETAAGDTTIGHALAYCRAQEGLAGVAAPPRAAVLRAILLELERMANHTGDLGALAGDVAYLPTSSYCGRLRGDFLNLTALLCGNRFGRNILTPGGIRFDLDPERHKNLVQRFTKAFDETENAINLLWNSASVLSRFEGCGKLRREKAFQLGTVGITARACGISRDIRCDHPYGIFCFSQLPVSVGETGDVLARAQVRWLEMQRSRDFIVEELNCLPESPIRVDPGTLRPETVVVSLIEGWRGEICHTAITDADGKFAAYKIVDPSFHNWPALAMALRDEEISNFPICNKSFNLSYCGHDL